MIEFECDTCGGVTPFEVVDVRMGFDLLCEHCGSDDLEEIR